MKNGNQTSEAIFTTLQRKINKPTTFNAAFVMLHRLKAFERLTQSTFYNHVRKLAGEKRITLTTTRELHPKRKPTYLINPIKLNA